MAIKVCERPLTMLSFLSWLNPFNWLLGRGITATSDGHKQFGAEKAPYDVSWIFPKLKKSNTKWWRVWSSLTIGSVGFLSKLFIGE